MFGSKPRPPHCEDLTEAQVKLVRKILKSDYHHHMTRHAAFALSQDWIDVFVAVAKNERAPYSSYKETFFEKLLEEDSGLIVREALPQMAGMNESHYAGLIATVLSKFDDATAACILDADIPANVRARAAASLIYNDPANERLAKLLAPPTNLHYDGGKLMKYALHYERFDVAAMLLERGFDLAIYADDIKAYLVEEKSPHAARLWLDKLGAPQTAAPVQLPAAQSLVQDGQGYLRSGDCTSRIDQLPDGGSLTTIFNFATCQQITIAHVAGQTAAPVITPFSHIEGTAALLDAAAAFIKQGGAPERVYSVTMTPSTRATLIEKPARAIAKPTSPDSP